MIGQYLQIANVLDSVSMLIYCIESRVNIQIVGILSKKTSKTNTSSNQKNGWKMMMLLLEMAPLRLHACFRVVNPPNFGREKFVLRPMIPVRSSGRSVISHPSGSEKRSSQAAMPHPYHKNHLTTGFNPSPHLDVAVFHARIRELGSQKGGPPGVLVAGPAVHPRHCGAPAGGIVRIQPQHVGLRIVLEGHHQHHATVQSFAHGFQATLQVEVIHIPEGFLHIGA